MRFINKVVLVTGSSRGLGKATALLFAKEGSKVIINYFNSKDEADKVVKEIKKIGSDAIAIKCDVSDENQVKKMIDDSVKRFGKIDILVNNAGIVFDVPYQERTVEQWKRTLEVNLIGVNLCCKYASKHMPKGGRIINISSNNGIYKSYPDSIDYDASKVGVTTITRAIAMEFAPKGILVNSVAPGWIDTEMNKDLPDDFLKGEIEQIWLKRFSKPEEIAKAILFLASEDASYITGSNLIVDGGFGA